MDVTGSSRAEACLEGVARGLVSEMENRRLFLFLITLVCDRSQKVEEKYEKLLFLYLTF